MTFPDLEPKGKFATSPKVYRIGGIITSVLASIFILVVVYLQVAVSTHWWPY